MQAVRERTRRKHVILAIIVVVLAVLVGICILMVSRDYIVRGASMEPTLKEGDRLSYSHFTSLAYGDLAIFRTEQDEYGSMIKRVIGLAGDTISVEPDGTVYRNGELLSEPYIKKDALGNSAMEEITIKQGYVFLMGDNRGVSIDSRDIRLGQVLAKDIYGCVTQIVREMDY